MISDGINDQLRPAANVRHDHAPRVGRLLGHFALR